MSIDRIKIASGFIFLLLISGCANQASVVDLEDHALQLERHQIELQKRLERIEGLSETPSPHIKNQQIISTGMVAQLSDIETDVRKFTGRVTETDHRVSSLDKKIDSESFRVQALLRRLDQLDARITRLEKGKKQDQKQSKMGFSSAGEKRRGLSPTSAYNLAYNDYLKGNYTVAIAAFDAFIEHYPNAVLVPEALYWKGESYYAEESYGSAIKTFQRMIQNDPKSEKISNALLKIGFAYLELGSPDKGKAFLGRVLDRFPNSKEAFLAKDKLVSLE